MLGSSTGLRSVALLVTTMAAEITLELVILGIGFFFYISVNIIMPGAGSNTFLSRDVLVK